MTGILTVQLLHDTKGCSKLPFPAVDDDEVRQFRVFSYQPLVPSPDDLGNRGKVINAFNGFDLKPPVILLVRQRRSGNWTIEPTMAVPERWEISKHSMTSGGSGRSRAACRSFTFRSFFRNAWSIFISTSSRSFFFSPIFGTVIWTTLSFPLRRDTRQALHPPRAGGSAPTGECGRHSTGQGTPQRNPRGSSKEYSCLLTRSPFSTEKTSR